MQNPRLAGRYAKSLVDLSRERGELDHVHEEMQYLREVCKVSREFVSLLRSPVIKGDKKQRIVDAVLSGRLGSLSAGFIRLLINKERESLLPEITSAFIEQYNLINKIHIVRLTTAHPVSEELREAILSKIRLETGLEHIELETVTKEELIGGFTLEFDNKLVDASIARDLHDIKKQFQQNIYIQNIR